MSSIKLIDNNLFFVINHLPHNVLSDTLALILSGIGSYGVVWIMIGIIIFIKEEIKDHNFYVQFVLTGAISVVVVEYLLKPLFGRIRPYALPGVIITDTTTHSIFSFPSTHAVMAFGFAYILSKKEPKRKVWMYALATMISFSRVYLGKHYPSDVIAGGILGIIIGIGVTILSKVLIQKKE